MKIRLLLLLIFLSCKSNKNELPKEVDILFIGNSLTYYNEMPNTLQTMLDETDTNFKISQSTYSGFSLLDHLSKIIVDKSDPNVVTRPKMEVEITETEKKLKEKDWDIIVLQSGNFHFLIPELKKYIINVAINEIIEIIDNPNTRIILFHTWPTKEPYEKEYCYPGKLIDKTLENKLYCSSKITTLNEEMKLLSSSYKTLGEKFNLELTSHGDQYYFIYKNYPKIELLEDTFHPSELGSFLNACIFYELLTGKSAKDLKYNGKLDKDVALFLKKITSN